MSNQFEPLDPEEVVVVKENYQKILIGQPTFRTRELTQQAIQVLKTNDSFVVNKCWSNHQESWVHGGVKAKVLKYGARDWQEGKIRMRIIVEFCPDEPEVEEIEEPPELESVSEPESPLDEIRRMIDEPNS